MSIKCNWSGGNGRSCWDQRSSESQWGKQPQMLRIMQLLLGHQICGRVHRICWWERGQESIQGRQTRLKRIWKYGSEKGWNREMIDQRESFCFYVWNEKEQCPLFPFPLFICWYTVYSVLHRVLIIGGTYNIWKTEKHWRISPKLLQKGSIGLSLCVS